MRYVLGIGFLLIISALPQAGHAMSDTFGIRTVIGNDTTAPSTPVFLVVIPQSTSSISVTWSTSTDNYVVAGYELYRDSIHIATTSQTSYIDTGLASSTLYTYTVRSFDSFGNFSTFSSSSATTTLASAPATSTPTTTATTTISTPGNGGSLQPTETTLEAIEITPDERVATVVVQSEPATRMTVRWGQTPDYELGYSSGVSYRTNHELQITGLEPSTLYEVEIILERRFSGEPIIVRRQFTTNSAPDVTAPVNVVGFAAERTDDGVALDWQNPSDPDFAYVRVVSSDQFYPDSPWSGWFVYEGTGEQAIDDRDFDTNARYYSVFAYDRAGNVSSGALLRFLREGSSGTSFDLLNEVLPSTTTPVTTDGKGITPLRFQDVIFIQDGLEQLVDGTSVTLDATKPTTVAIPYNRLPEHLKMVVVSLQPTDGDSRFSFLLRINNDRTAYQATFDTLPISGEYQVVIDVFDFETNRTTNIGGLANFVDDFRAGLDRSTGSGGVQIAFTLSLWLLLLLLTAWTLRRWWQRI